MERSWQRAAGFLWRCVWANIACHSPSVFVLMPTWSGVQICRTTLHVLYTGYYFI
jgi:hypothetical protein